MISTDLAIETRQTSLAALRRWVGVHWQDVQGELHLQYNELPTWIMLYEDTDIDKAHRALCETLEPFMASIAPLQFTVTYLILTPEFQITVESLMDNDEILEGLTRPGFGKLPTTDIRRSDGLFGNAISVSRPV